MKILLISIFATFTALNLISSAQIRSESSTSLILPETTISFQFDQPLIEEKLVGTVTPNNTLRISPQWKGKLKWIDKSSCEFIPSEAPKLNTTYKFSNLKQSKYFDDSIIPDFSHSHRSQPFVLTYRLNLDSLRATRSPRTYIRFNDSVDASKSTNQFYYVNKSGTKLSAHVTTAQRKDLRSDYYIKPSWGERFQLAKKSRRNSQANGDSSLISPEQALSNALIITPATPLSVGKDWKLVLTKGIKNKQGTQQTKVGTHYNIGSVHPLSVTITPSVQVDENRSISLYLNHQIPEGLNHEQLATYFQAVPTINNLKLSRQNASTIKIAGDLYAQDEYSITLKQNFAATNGLVTQQDITQKIHFNYAKPELSLPSFSNAQLANGSRQYELRTVNMKHAKIRVKQLTQQQAITAYQKYGDYIHHYNNDKKNPINYDDIPGTTIYDQDVQLSNKIDTSQKIPFSWDNVIPKQAPNTTLFIAAEGTPKDQLADKLNKKTITQSIIQLTDIGLAWKISNNQLWIYTYSCQTGEPLEDVSLSIYGKNSTKITTAKTDAHGLCQLQRDQEKETHIVATNGSDSFITSLNQSINQVGMWRFPVNFDYNEIDYWERDVMLFSDRSLYKPGETVRLKGICREYKDTAIRLSNDRTANYYFKDAQYRTIASGSVSISKQGSFDIEQSLPNEKVGRFTFQIDFENQPENLKTKQQDQRRRNFSHSFQVQEFRRNAFEIITNLEAPAPASKKIQLNLDARYYQGTPVSEGKMNWYYYASSIGFYPDTFRAFQFGDHREYDPYYWSHYFGYNDNSYQQTESNSINGSTTLTPDGNASLEVDIKSSEFPSAKKITFHCEVTDSRNQTLNSSATSTVHPGTHYYGIARVDKLIRVNEETPLEFIHVGLDGKLSQTATNATLKIEREYHESTKTTDSNNRYRVRNEKRTEIISTQDIRVLGTKTTSYKFEASKPGRYILTLSGLDPQNNPIATATSFYVYGKEVYPWATADGMRIKLVSEQKSYQPGDTARLLVMTPIEGTALVTVERQGVLRHYKRNLTTASPVIEIPIEKADAPNAYISVLLIRGAEQSTHIAKEPALKLGFCEINVEDKTTQLNVALDIPGSYHRPGEEITVNGTISDYQGKQVSNAEVTLYAEDEGILAVAGYSLPNPLSHFYRSRPLNLRTGVSLYEFISEDSNKRYFGNKGFVVGDAKGGLASDANFDLGSLRKNFDPCAFWQPTITTSADGSFSIKTKVPDTLTRYRVMAIASSGALRYGSAQTDVVISKDIMLEPANPRFAHEGDHHKIKLLVQNASDYDGEWDISLQTHGLLEHQLEQQPNTASISHPASSDVATRTITLNSGESKTLEFPVIYTNTGEARLLWKATPKTIANQELDNTLQHRLSDMMETKFQVAFPRPLLKHQEIITLKQEEDLLFGNVDKRLMEGRGKAKVELSNSLLLDATGAMDFLLKYPYGCLEQTTSSMMPWFAVNDLRHVIPDFGNKSDKEVLSALQKGADRIISMQTSSGGLAYWPGGNEPELWASSYGGMGLIMAHKAGAKVPEDVIAELIAYLQDSIRETPLEKSSVWQNDSVCRTLYVLALAHKDAVEPSLLNLYYDNRAKLSNAARHYLALAIHHTEGKKELAIELLTSPSTVKQKRHWMRHSNINAIQLLAWSQIDPKNAFNDKMLQAIIKSKNQQGHWNTTWVNGWTLNAFASYAKHVEASRPDTTVHLNGEDIVLNQANPTRSITLSLDEAASIKATSIGTAYARVYVESKPETAATKAESHNGVKIKRHYHRVNANGKKEPLRQPKVGDLIQVDLTVTFADELHYVVIDDTLPSIMETINGDFASQKAHIADPSKNNHRISRRELRSDRALFFINKSWGKNTQTISYLARITSAGTVHAPPAKVEAMYDPSTYALTKASTITAK